MILSAELRRSRLAERLDDGSGRFSTPALEPGHHGTSEVRKMRDRAAMAVQPRAVESLELGPPREIEDVCLPGTGLRLR